MLASILILTLFGIFLLMVEIFLPGGVAGALGVIAILVAVGLTLMSEELVGWTSGMRMALALGIVIFSASVLLVWLRWFAVKFFHRSLTLTASIDTRPPLTAALGSHGVALTELRPLGRVEIEGKRYDVRCQTGVVSAGTPVEVIATEPGNLLVRPLPV